MLPGVEVEVTISDQKNATRLLFIHLFAKLERPAIFLELCSVGNWILYG
jgi:hypothetical protein